MFGTETQATSWLLLAILLCGDVRSDEPAGPADAVIVETFTRAALLRRFDGDRDHELNATERVALRDAFGRIDIPMLPTEPYRYVADETPSHIASSDLRRADNTSQDNPITNIGATLGRVP